MKCARLARQYDDMPFGFIEPPAIEDLASHKRV
jgi:hypothetical protein